MEESLALALIRTEYNRLDKICNVDTSKIKISISSRMTRSLGSFNYKKLDFGEELSIKISDRILNYNELFYDVIRHEYAHAIVHIRHPHNKHNHDDVWKAACLEVDCIPKASRKISAMENVNHRPYKYLLRCQSCGAESKYVNQSKVIKIALNKRRGTVVCKRCGSKDFTLEMSPTIFHFNNLSCK